MIGHLVTFAIPAAYTLLPPAMNSRAATAMLIAIALQESRATWRLQIGGPARGFWQFERNGGVLGVLTHTASRSHIESAARALRYEPQPGPCYEAIAHNDVLAAAFARCLLWTLPGGLPLEDAPDDGWRQYVAAWKPGRPHRGTWDAFYLRAWEIAGNGED